MTPATIPITIYANNGFREVINCIAPPTNGYPASVNNLGVPIDLSTYTSALMQIRATQEQSSTLILTFSTSPSAGQGTITLGGGGVLTVSAEQSIVADLVPGGYWYDIVLKASGVDDLAVQGPVTVLSGVTTP